MSRSMPASADHSSIQIPSAARAAESRTRWQSPPARPALPAAPAPHRPLVSLHRRGALRQRAVELPWLGLAR